jgi:hypothetical protein
VVARVERRELRRATATYALQYPVVLQYHGAVHVGERGRGPAARAVRGVGNAGRGASPTTDKREGFFFNLLFD